jgi:hypothetical protein
MRNVADAPSNSAARSFWARTEWIAGGIVTVLFAIAPHAAASAQTLTVLHDFSDSYYAPNGAFPEAAVVFNPTTNALFGTTPDGGDLACEGGNGWAWRSS